MEYTLFKDNISYIEKIKLFMYEIDDLRMVIYLFYWFSIYLVKLPNNHEAILSPKKLENIKLDNFETEGLALIAYKENK